ncbi:hypothetical protein ACFUJV_20160 [Streptomyces olivaceus]|uniref:hypothetical protein n=1 Tax=Streptomyces TaxID=1883 RepID=UPI001FB63FDA|nr:hypothetical protein [Streptomyces sp. CB09030]UOG78213.1 hypothetical protein L6J92_02895 [Streptomyces sp. CB09030]
MTSVNTHDSGAATGTGDGRGPVPPHLPSGAATAAFSLGLVASALAGIGVGRILDRSGPALS